jgi:tRNA U34 5-methylaminomethyl-2-thiouridine-forming methyltransferase MnmC
MSTWSERPTADGSWTLWNEALGEACHSSAGAWQQARLRYARACRLHEHGRNVVGLLDVGTGLGLNLAAALEALAAGTRLEVLTLESDGEAIERGLELYERAALRAGPWEPWHAPVRAALRSALAAPLRPIEWAGPGGTRHGLVLRLGDARTTITAHARTPAFDAVFLDPFSPRRSPELWEAPFLAELAARLAPTGWLSTYSASFRVRLALAQAGLRVGRGPRVGRKGEGTLASPGLAPPALAPRVERRLERRTRAATAVAPAHFAVSFGQPRLAGRLECEARGHAHRPPGVREDPLAWATPRANEP